MRAAFALLLLTACRLHFDDVATDADPAGVDDAMAADDGAVASGTQVTLSTTGTCVSVAWSGDRAGVVWREGSNPGDVWFATVDTAGTVLDGPFTIGTALANLDCPTIEWTGGQFLVAISSGTLNQRDVDVTAITGTSVSTFINMVTDSADSRTPMIGYLGGNAIVTWQSAQGASTDVMFRRVSPNGTTTFSASTASGAQATNGVPTVAATAATFAMFWVASAGVHLDNLNLGGAQQGEMALGGLGTAGGRLASAYTGSDIMLAWATGSTNTQLVVTRLAVSGALLAGPTSTPAERAEFPDAVWTGSRLGVLYNETFGLVQTHLAQFDGDGMFINDTPVVSATTNSELSLAWAGDRYVAAVRSNQGVIAKFILPP